MKQIIILLTIALLALTSCHAIDGDGDVITKEFGLDKKFSEIHIYEDECNVDIFDSEEYKVVITAERNILEYMDVFVKNEKLKIKTPSKYLPCPSKPIEIAIYAPSSYDKVSNHGSANVNIHPHFNQYKLKVENLGRGQMFVEEIHNRKFEIYNAQSGYVEAVGETEELYISNQGRGPVDCYYMTANNAEIRCYGSGYVDAFVIGTANIYGEYGRECARIYGTRYIVYYDE